jgi:hypothetical protein
VSIGHARRRPLRRARAPASVGDCARAQQANEQCPFVARAERGSRPSSSAKTRAPGKTLPR